MDITDQIARAYGATPFDVLTQEADYVIMLINYLTEKADSEPVKAERKARSKSRKNDGFWDF